MLFELPEVLLVEILTLAGLQSAGRVLSSKKLERCHASSLDDLLWSTLVLKRWAIAALPATGNWSWRSFATFLETEVRGLLRFCRRSNGGRVFFEESVKRCFPATTAYDDSL